MKTINKNEIVNVVMIPRFIHVVNPAAGSGSRKVQTASDLGRLMVYDTTPAIFQAVLGSRSGDSKQYRNLGLRQLTRVIFRGHFTAEGLLVGVDIVPKRMFARGAAPKEFGKALKNGFEISWDPAINGFDVRHGHSGMADKTLYDLLDALRAYNWKNSKKTVIGDYKVEKTETNTFRATPINPKGSYEDQG